MRRIIAACTAGLLLASPCWSLFIVDDIYHFVSDIYDRVSEEAEKLWKTSMLANSLQQIAMLKQNYDASVSFYRQMEAITQNPGIILDRVQSEGMARLANQRARLAAEFSRRIGDTAVEQLYRRLVHGEVLPSTGAYLQALEQIQQQARTEIEATQDYARALFDHCAGSAAAIADQLVRQLSDAALDKTQRDAALASLTALGVQQQIDTNRLLALLVQYQALKDRREMAVRSFFERQSVALHQRLQQVSQTVRSAADAQRRRLGDLASQALPQRFVPSPRPGDSR